MPPSLTKCYPRTGHEVLALATSPLKGNPAPTVQKAGWASRPVWTGAQNQILTPVLNPQTIHPTARHYTGVMKVYKGSKAMAPL
jgi:hypothetical protein